MEFGANLWDCGGDELVFNQLIIVWSVTALFQPIPRCSIIRAAWKKQIGPAARGTFAGPTIAGLTPSRRLTRAGERQKPPATD
jgi:hypothetical protein